MAPRNSNNKPRFYMMRTNGLGWRRIRGTTHLWLKMWFKDAMDSHAPGTHAYSYQYQHRRALIDGNEVKLLIRIGENGEIFHSRISFPSTGEWGDVKMARVKPSILGACGTN